MKHELEKIINLCSADGINSKSKIKVIAQRLLIEAELHDLYNQFHFASDLKTKNITRFRINELHVKLYQQKHPMNEDQI